MLKRIFFGVVIVFISAVMLLGCHFSVGGYHGQPTTNFDGAEFKNQVPFDRKGLWQVAKWRWTRKDPGWPKWVESQTPSVINRRVFGQKVVVTPIGHATVLIQTQGVNILTDPIYSDRASPVTWAGPKRIRAPGIAFAKLPPIDLVMVSHNHYDHMDVETLKRLESREHPLILVGLGNGTFLAQEGIKHVRALNWWQSARVKGVKVTMVPAQHFSGRGLFDTMKTLWGGYVISAKRGPIYFAGDTAVGPHFKQIYQRFGPVFIALLPIGAYEPRDFMKIAHINPEGAVKAMLVLHAKHAIGIHYDTFAGMADEKFGQASKDLVIALKKHNVSQQRFLAQPFGVSKVFP